MAQIQQLAEGVFYVPRPRAGTNALAAFVANFTQSRSDWARQGWFDHLRQLSPAERLAAIVQLERQATEREIANQQAIVDSAGQAIDRARVLSMFTGQAADLAQSDISAQAQVAASRNQLLGVQLEAASRERVAEMESQALSPELEAGVNQAVNNFLGKVAKEGPAQDPERLFESAFGPLLATLDDKGVSAGTRVAIGRRLMSIAGSAPGALKPRVEELVGLGFSVQPGESLAPSARSSVSVRGAGVGTSGLRDLGSQILQLAGGAVPAPVSAPPSLSVDRSMQQSLADGLNPQRQAAPPAPRVREAPSSPARRLPPEDFVDLPAPAPAAPATPAPAAPVNSEPMRTLVIDEPFDIRGRRPRRPPEADLDPEDAAYDEALRLRLAEGLSTRGR